MPEVDDGVLVPGVLHDGRSPDAALLAEFTAAYRGPHDPRDALAWLTAPSSPGPSGAPSPAAQLAPLRERLYRPDVTPADRQRFDRSSRRVRSHSRCAAAALDTARTRCSVPEAEQPITSTARVTPSRPRGGRRGWTRVGVGTAAAIVLALVVALVPELGPRPSSTEPRAVVAPASTVRHPSAPAPDVVVPSRLEFVGSAAQRRDGRKDLAALFVPGRTRTLGEALTEDRAWPSGAMRGETFVVDHRGRGPAVVSLHALGGVGSVTSVRVLMVCATRAPYSVVLTTDTPEGDRSRVGRTGGTDCADAPVTAVFAPAHRLIPTALTVQVPADLDYLIEVDRSAE